MAEIPYTVSKLTREIKDILESNFPVIRLRGEISNFRQQQSGHMYFSLKDSGASISCVCFRGDAARLKVRLKDGLQIVGTGRINVYEPRGNYQIIFRIIEEDELPKLARRIAFVTSESGAALRDFVSILRRRSWSGQLLVIPARVQGQEAAPEIVRGIELANQHQLCDLLVIGRGGGSLEDLWPFNEEIVARAVAASSIPLISAVGHEIDFTLSDFAADFRAETPSAAAEWITSSRQEYLDTADQLKNRLIIGTERQLERKAHQLSLIGTHLKHQHPRNRLDQAALRLDDLQGRLGQTLLSSLQLNHQKLELLKSRYIGIRPETRLQHCSESLRQLTLRLVNNSHQSALKRGYAIVRSCERDVLSDASAIKVGDAFLVEMRDGTFKANRDEDGTHSQEQQS
jgi:exodeoxyribonuclease VII large subunit